MREPSFLAALRRDVTRHELGDMAAMLTYYAVMAIFPMIVFVLTVALLLVPEPTIRQGVEMVTRAMPDEVARIVFTYVQNLRNAAGGLIAVLSVLLALWAASRGTVAMGRALNRVHEVEETRPWWKVQLVAVAVTALVAVLLIVGLGLLAAGPAVGHQVARTFGLGHVFDVTWSVGRWLLAAILQVGVWAILYRLLPSTAGRPRPVMPGAMMGVLLWIVASLGFALYVANFGKYEKTYGALGAAIIFLMWLWISNLVMLVGAEVNVLLARRRGKLPERAAHGLGLAHVHGEKS